LSALGYAHLKGVVHCNLAPEHLLITPPDSLICLFLDWTGAAYQRHSTISLVREGFSSSGSGGKKISANTGFGYLCFGKCMIYALGGNEKSGEMPKFSPSRDYKIFWQGFIMESPIQRPDDAWKLHHRLSIFAARQWWGPDKFFEVREYNLFSQ